MIICDKCNVKYIGETERRLRDRISEHKTYITNDMKSKATGEHFNKPGHSVRDLRVVVLEKVKKIDENYRKEREKYMINMFDTYYNGLNRQPQKAIIVIKWCYLYKIYIILEHFDSIKPQNVNKGLYMQLCAK